MKARNERSVKRTRGMALGLVLMIGIIVLVLGFAMITTSGGLLANSVDSKQRIKSRMAAESQANMMMAAAVEKASSILGGDMTLPNMSLQPLPTQDSTKASATATLIGGPGGDPIQEQLRTGAFRGMMGYLVAYNISSTGIAPGGAKTRIDASIRMHQVPVFQFGVFYEGNLEITPGQKMIVGGPVHTNANAFFRSPMVPGAVLGFQGPITAVGSIYQWSGSVTAQCALWYQLAPDMNSIYSSASPILPEVMTQMTTFPDFRGVANVRWGVERLNLPIDGALPREILMPSTPADPPGLRRQKFDSPKASRWVNGEGPKPAWITGPKVFFDRREKAWVKFWDFSVADITTKDSIFYLADLVPMNQDRGTLHDTVINAFRIVNASRLPRNMTIATPNPVYVLGDFNSPSATSTCGPAGVTNPPLADKYCNAMIASDAFTLLSPLWAARNFASRGMDGTLEQDSANPYWTMVGGTPSSPVLASEPLSGSPDTIPWAFPRTNITLNAAIMTGNKASGSNALPPLNTSNNIFEQNYDGGWHNTIRFLEHLGQATVTFKGSFVCMWEAQTPGLNRAPGRVIQTLPAGYYAPPDRIWGFDTRFRQLANMPPATPFLATAPSMSFSEVR